MPHYFTRSGDDGSTGTLGDTRLPKEHPRMEALGTLDETSAAIGLARAAVQGSELAGLLLQAQRDLYRMMAEVAASPENAARFRGIDPRRITWLEEQIAAYESITRMPNDFIVPGDTSSGAALALARTITRRAERRVSELVHAGELENPSLLPYLNRLSSFLFLLELYENQRGGSASHTLAKNEPS